MILFESKNLVSGYTSGFCTKPVSLVVRQGDRIGITGPNGSGKSVFVKTLLGLLRPLSGRIDRPSQLKIGFVPQFHDVNGVMPITVTEVLAASCRHPGKKLSAHTNPWNIRPLLHKSFHELSGGQKQKVLITRMMLLEPEVMVLDEPTNHMDATSRKKFWDWLKTHPVKAVLIVEHDTSKLADVVNHTVEFGDE